MRTERRQTPRVPVEGLAYVNLEPNNGGIILDISEGGLCFDSTTPVQQIATIRFWFSQRNHRIEAGDRLAWKGEPGSSWFIEAESELAWTDEARKRGGLRFTHLPAEAHKEIRDWISQHAMPVVNEKSAPSLPSSREFPSLSANRRDTTAACRGSAALGVLSPAIQAQARRLLTGFPGGLVAGVLVSALVAAIFLLQTHRRELGESVIHFGERLAGRSWAQPASPEPRTMSSESRRASSRTQAAAAPQTTSPEPHTASSETKTVSHPQIPVAPPEKLLSQPGVAAVKPHGVKLEAVTPGTATVLSTARADSGTPTTTLSTPPRPSVPANAVAPIADSSSGTLRAAAPPTESANQPSVHIERSKEEGTASPPEKYLEVAKLSDKLWAEQMTDRLSQVGFPVMVIQKNRFWKKFYQVLVGPYASDPEAEAAHKNLASRGFTPRSYERGKRKFMLTRSLRLAGTRMPVGDCVISWESYMPAAIVKFETDTGVAVAAEGKWVKHDVKYEQNAIVYTKNIDGSLTLLEIQFSGMRQALVFGRGSI
jgi:septal ring-binding cell division protein DamX